MEEEEYYGCFKRNRAVISRDNRKLLESDNAEGRFSFCLVIPFPLESDMKKAKDRIVESRGCGERWFVDELIIPETDFMKLVSKSNKVRILFSLDKKDEKELEEI